MERKKFLIIGHPRSGTGFMSALMKRHGYDVGHERLGMDGISSWMFAVNERQVFGDSKLRRGDFEFDFIVMNIRHPLHMISSTYFTENVRERSFTFRNKYIELDGLNQVEMAVKSVLEWYRLIELQRPNFKVCIDKNPEREMYYFLRRFENISLQEPVTKITRKINPRNHTELTFSFIKKNCNKGLVLELENFCYLYGYNIGG
ncbi:hypothetical protein ACFQ3N_11100 [Virgibacillus byunsanensis]|uniref:Sulfotransferase family protein n=1 Tax=Virgibacillus byunsanensis TaxID=570945 RepID=A0ABW3LKK7_9BACI